MAGTGWGAGNERVAEAWHPPYVQSSSEVDLKIPLTRTASVNDNLGFAHPPPARHTLRSSIVEKLARREFEVLPWLAMTTPLALLIGLLAISGALAWSRRSSGHELDGRQGQAPPPPPLWDVLSALGARVADLEVKVQGLPGVWEEHANRAERAAERERKAAKRRDASAGDEQAEPAAHVPRSDVPAGGEGWLPQVHAGMGQGRSNEQAAALALARRAMALSNERHG